MDKGPWFDEALAWKLKKQFKRHDNIKRGDIICFHRPGFVAWSIRALTGKIGKPAKVDHVARCIDNDYNIVHARLKLGVIKQPLADYMAESWKIKAYVVRNEDYTPEMIDEIITCTLNRIGNKYDRLAIFSLAWRSILKIIPFVGKLAWKIPLVQVRLEDFCSELIQTCDWLVAKIKYTGKHHISTCTPYDIFKRLTFIDQY